MIKAILFDKDGTLLEFSNIYTDSLVEFLKSKNISETEKEKLFREVGIDENGRAVENSILSSETIEDIAQVLAPYFGEEKEDLFKEIDDNIFEYYKENKERIKMTCDVSHLFKTLKEKDLIIGIFTSDNYRQTKFAMDYLDLSKYIDFVATADIYKKKPDKEGLEVFKEKFNIKDDEIIVIGDSRVDMLFGDDSLTLGVTCGTGSEKMLSQYADHIIENPTEVLKFI